MSKNWPRLTETLKGPRDYHCCTSCGARPSALVDLQLWQEHDDGDKPELRFLLLCKRCSPMIEPHDRLYKSHGRWAPAPGAMERCMGCQHHVGLRCAIASAVKVEPGAHSVAFVDGTRNGRRAGWREVFYSQQPKSCSGFTPAGRAAPVLAEDEEIIEL